MNRSNKLILVMYVVISALVLSMLISIDSSLERPTRQLNLVPKPLSEITFTKIVPIEKTTIFNAFEDIQNYPYVLPNNVIEVKNISGKPSTYEITLIEKGLKTTLTIEHISSPHDKQIFKVINGDAQGTTIVQTFDSVGNETKISVNISLKTRGILTPFSFLPIINANHALDTIITSFVDYAKRPYSENEKIVDNLYRELLLRPADPTGLRHYADLLNEKSIDEIRNELRNSEEYNSRILLTDLKDVNELSDQTKKSINEFYNIILRRDVDDKGLGYFGSALENGKITLHEIRDKLLTSDEFNSLPEETRELRETYGSNPYWQIVNQTYYDIHGTYPSKKIVRAYGIFFEKGEISLDEMKKLLSK